MNLLQKIHKTLKFFTGFVWNKESRDLRSEFAFIDFRDSSAGRQAYMRGSTLAVWEVMLVLKSYKANLSAAAKHLKWPEVRVQAAVNYAKAFPDEIETAISENADMDFDALKRMLPHATEFGICLGQGV